MKKENPYKVVIMHPLQQHSYRLAAALKEKGILCKYVTTIYMKKGTLMNSLVKLLKGDNQKRLLAKRCAALDDEEVKVICEPLGILMLFINRIDHKKKVKIRVDRLLAKRFGVKAAKYAIRCGADAVVMYDSYAGAGFQYLKKKAPHIKRIMDASAAYAGYVGELIDRESQNSSELETVCKKTYPEYWDNKWRKEVFCEVHYSDYILAASQYCANSYVRAGLDAKAACIVPYGVDINKFVPAKTNESDKLILIYCGNGTVMKGLRYLLDVMTKLEDMPIKLIVVGAVDIREPIYVKYANAKNVEFTGKVNHEQINEYYQSAHVYVLPTLTEGLSLAGLEAMASGLPLICTTHSGVSDLIREGENGFVIPIADETALYERVLWCFNNKQTLGDMSIHARKTAEGYSWKRYNQNVGEAFEKIIMESEHHR